MGNTEATESLASTESQAPSMHSYISQVIGNIGSLFATNTTLHHHGTDDGGQEGEKGEEESSVASVGDHTSIAGSRQASQ